MKSHLDRPEAKQLGDLAREFELNPPTSRKAFASAIMIAMNNGIKAEAIALACGVGYRTVEEWPFLEEIPGYFKRRRIIRTIIGLLKKKQRQLETP